MHATSNGILLLLRKRKPRSEEKFIDISHSAETFDWLSPLQDAIARDAHITLYSDKEPLSGILGFFNCLRKEPGGGNTKCVFVQDIKAPRFDPSHQFYRNVLDKGLVLNVYKNGKWGTYRHLKLDVPYHKAVDNCFASVRVKGNLSSFYWIEGKSTKVDNPTDELVHVR